ncbi:MAG: FkbM family methyltransferase [Xanthobacteraceae bacterium]
MRHLIKSGLKVLPAKDALLALGAGLPPLLKGAVSERVFGALARARESSAPLTLTTNLGIDSRITITLPSFAPVSYLFGTPKQYAGERGALMLACELAGDAGGFVDIGANYGYFSFAIAARHGDRVPIHYFEPNVELFSIIAENVHRLNFKTMIGHRKGIGNCDDVVRFYLDTVDNSQSSLSVPHLDDARYQPVDIQVISFASFCKNTNLDNLLVKVDVEGAEFRFLEGVGDAARHIAYLIIEVLGGAMSGNFIASAEAQLGMRSYYINDYQLQFSPGENFRYVPPQFNWLFTRVPPEELAKRLKGTKLTVTV